MAESIPNLDLDALGGDEEPSCSFTFHGRVWKVRSQDDLAWATVVELLGQKDDQDAAEMSVKIGPFMQAVLVPEDADDFMALINDASKGLKVKQVAPLVEHVAKQLFARPTQRPSSSSAGPRKTGRSSRASSSSQATLPAALNA